MNEFGRSKRSIVHNIVSAYAIFGVRNEIVTGIYELSSDAGVRKKTTEL